MESKRKQIEQLILSFVAIYLYCRKPISLDCAYRYNLNRRNEEESLYSMMLAFTSRNGKQEIRGSNHHVLRFQRSSQCTNAWNLELTVNTVLRRRWSDSANKDEDELTMLGALRAMETASKHWGKHICIAWIHASSEWLHELPVAIGRLGRQVARMEYHATPSGRERYIW